MKKNLKNGYFDLQVNGYAGIDFNQNNLTAKDLHKSCKKLKEDRVNGILATIISADIADMSIRLQKIVSLREEDSIIKEIIKGIHIEGPFLSKEPGYSGAHSPEFILPANIDIMKYLLDAAHGLTRIVTLAPEVDKNKEVIKMLSRDGITVSAGHCDTSIKELKESIDAGLSMFTHFGNGCPQKLNRHDNIIQRALTFKQNLWYCFIADGIHIPIFVLKNYLEMVGMDKAIIVSDAMAGTAAAPGKYKLSNLLLEVGKDKIVREPGKQTFSGSAFQINEVYNNLINRINLSSADAQKLTLDNPMKSIGFNNSPC